MKTLQVLLWSQITVARACVGMPPDSKGESCVGNHGLVHLDGGGYCCGTNYPSCSSWCYPPHVCPGGTAFAGECHGPPCTCDNGTPPHSFHGCSKHETHICESCDEGFVLDGKKCTKIKKIEHTPCQPPAVVGSVVGMTLFNKFQNGWDIYTGRKASNESPFKNIEKSTDETSSDSTGNSLQWPKCTGCPWSVSPTTMISLHEATSVFSQWEQFYNRLTYENGASMDDAFGVSAGLQTPAGGLTGGVNIARTFSESQTMTAATRVWKAGRSRFAWSRLTAVVAEITTSNLETYFTDKFAKMIEDAETEEDWKHIYYKYGTHFLTSARVGGISEHFMSMIEQYAGLHTDSQFEACASKSTCLEFSGGASDVPTQVGLASGSFDLKYCPSSASCNSAVNTNGKESSSLHFQKEFTTEGGDTKVVLCGDPSTTVQRYLESMNPDNLHVWSTKFTWFGKFAKDSARNAAGKALASHAAAYMVTITTTTTTSTASTTSVADINNAAPVVVTATTWLWLAVVWIGASV